MKIGSSVRVSAPRSMRAANKAAAVVRVDEGSRLGYLPALDGLRAVAVAAVLVYHADLGWLPGGFLGVDVFFVLSGYLITCLLLADWRSTGGIGFRRFWLRRARRLLPALFTMLAVTCAYAVVFLPHEAAKLRSDVLAALGYVTNWYLIFRQQSYFAAAGRPSMVQHLWSLAVEEQFYLLWPLLFGAGLVVFRRHRGRLVTAILAAAGVSALLMALLYREFSDPSRVYYGTDTHASGLLIGAALALVWAPWRLSAKTGRGASAFLNLTGILALGALVWCLRNVSEFDAGLYRGGYLAIALVTAVVIAVAAHPATRLCRGLLGNAPLRWIGQRSYGIYLWHWPVFLITRPRLDTPLTGITLFVLRVTITVTLAALSFRFVEAPIRSGAFGRRLAALRHGTAGQRRRLLARLALVGTALAGSLALLGLGLASAQPAPKPPGFSSASAHIAITTTTTAPAPSTTVALPTAAPAPAPPTVPLPPPAPPPVRVTAIGDSVMLGARSALHQILGANLQLDAAVSRQFPDAIAVVRSLRAAGQLGDDVIIHLGTNGTISEKQFNEMMQLLSGVRRVLVVNSRVPRPWEQEVNETLAAGVPHYQNAVLVNWHDPAAAHPEFFVEDGVHLTTDGAHFYADLIARQL